MNMYIWAVLWLLAIPLAYAIGLPLLIFSSRIPKAIWRLLAAALLLALAAAAAFYGWTWADHTQGPCGGLILLISALATISLLAATIPTLKPS